MNWLRLRRSRDDRPTPEPIPDEEKRKIIERDEAIQRNYIRAQTEALRVLQDVRRGIDV